MFLKAVREDSAWSESVFVGEKETTRQSVLAAARWREMSDDEKRVRDTLFTFTEQFH
jgi:hypothetical protein